MTSQAKETIGAQPTPTEGDFYSNLKLVFCRNEYDKEMPPDDQFAQMGYGLYQSLPERAKISFSRASQLPQRRIQMLLGVQPGANECLIKTFQLTYPESENYFSKNAYSGDDGRVLRKLVTKMVPYLASGQPPSDPITEEIESLRQKWSKPPNQVYIKWDSFYIFGCPLSTDIDIALVVDCISGIPTNTLVEDSPLPKIKGNHLCDSPLPKIKGNHLCDSPLPKIKGNHLCDSPPVEGMRGLRGLEAQLLKAPPTAIRPPVEGMRGLRGLEAQLLKAPPTAIRPPVPQIDFRELRQELSKLGYSDERKIDVNLIRLDSEGYLAESSKGDRWQTSRIIMATYQYHRQAYPLPNLVSDEMIMIYQRDPDLVLRNQVRTCAKYILDNLETLVCENLYKRLRPKKTQAYNGYWRRVEFVSEILDQIVPPGLGPDSPELTRGWQSCWKSLTMKIIQLVLLTEGKEEYTKEGLADAWGQIVSDQLSSDVGGLEVRSSMLAHSAHALYYLTRGTMGHIGSSNLLSGELEWPGFRELLNAFRDVASRFSDPGEFAALRSSMLPLAPNPTQLPDSCYQAFLRSPIKVSDEFLESWPTQFIFEGSNPDQLNDYFHLRCRNIDVLSSEFRRDHVVELDQRTVEWREALQFYTCGRNSGVLTFPCQDLVPGSREYTKEFLRFYFHLIRGCLVELMVLENLDWQQFFPDHLVTPISVGLLVEQKGVPSRGIAPDLLLKVSCVNSNSQCLSRVRCTSLLPENDQLEENANGERCPAQESDYLVPVEIKCLNCEPNDNTDFRRALDLAKRELSSSCELLGANRGLMIFVFVYQTNSDKGDQQIHFEPKYQTYHHTVKL